MLESLAELIHHPKLIRTHQCKVCNAALGRSDTLARHIREVHGDDREKKFLCCFNSCKHSRKGFGFARQQHLDRHLKACREKRSHHEARTANTSRNYQTHLSRTAMDASNPQESQVPNNRLDTNMNFDIQDNLTKTLSVEKQWLLMVQREYSTRNQTISQQIAHIDAILRNN